MPRTLFVLPAIRWMACAACALGFVTGRAEAARCEAEPTDMPAAYGELITCDIAPGTDTDLYRFSGAIGDTVLIEATFTSGAGFLPRLRLIAPDGSILGEASSPARMELVLSQSGPYTAIVFENGANNTGEYTFLVSCLAGSCPPIPPTTSEGAIQCEPEPTDMLPHYGTRVACDLTPSTDTDLYRFVGNAGDRVLAEAVFVSGAGFLPGMRLIAPDGTLVGETFAPALLDVVLAQTGLYTAIVMENGANNLGEYAFTVSCLAGTCIAPGGQPTLTLTLTGCNECVAGNQFTVQARWRNPGASSARVEAKVGLRLPNGTKSNVLGNKHLEVTLPAGFDVTSTLFTFAWPAGLPPGMWTLEGTLVGPDLGETHSRDVNAFTVLP
jgi:hypothetical protein